MRPPFTTEPGLALSAAHISLGVTLLAHLWHRPLPRRLPTALMACAIAAAALEPAAGLALGRLAAGPWPALLAGLVRGAVGAASAAAALGRLRPRALPLLGGAAVLSLCIATKDTHLAAALLLLWVGALLGLERRAPNAAAEEPAEPPRGGRRSDSLVAVAALALAAAACWLVQERFCNSADEWANTFQADLFAHGKSYAAVPPCAPLFQSAWIFFHEGRAFAQYTPGWPLFMAPFQRLHGAWLAAPTAFGLLVAAALRLARRTQGDERDARVAALLTALSLAAGYTMLMNAASRYPHTFVCALYAWALEAACVLAQDRPGRGAQLRWAALLGLCLGWLLSARPTDGITLGAPVAAYALYALCRGRVRWAAAAAGALPLLVLSLLTLLILRQQVGAWLRSGYSLAAIYQPRGGIGEFDLGHAATFQRLRFLVTGSYCWWPCAPALGALGLCAARRSARPLALLLGAGALLSWASYGALSVPGRVGFGYGHRYLSPLLLAFALGGAAALTPLWRRARDGGAGRSRLQRLGPLGLCLAAGLGGLLCCSAALYPDLRREIRRSSAPLRAVERAGLRRAVVTFRPGDVAAQAYDLTQNFLSEPEPDVLYLIERGDALDRCARERFPGRTFYRAVGVERITLTPY